MQSFYCISDAGLYRYVLLLAFSKVVFTWCIHFPPFFFEIRQLDVYFRCACSHLYHVQILVALEACRHFKQFFFLTRNQIKCWRSCETNWTASMFIYFIFFLCDRGKLHRWLLRTLVLESVSLAVSKINVCSPDFSLCG